MQFAGGVLRAYLPIALLLFSGSPAAAQVAAGSISGMVQDEQRAVIPGAKVALINQAQGAVAGEMTTSVEGTFVFTPVLPSTYTVAVEASGFKKYSQRDIVVYATAKVGLPPIVLQLGSVGDSVTVEANVVSLQTVSAERSGIITQRQMLDLGTLGRSFMDFMKTIPGVTADTSPGSMSGNVNGTRTEQGSWAIDGVTSMDTGCNCYNFRVNTDVISEFKVLTNGQQAEFGRSSGMNIAVITKSGTREFHGSGYTFIRNEWMNATSWMNNYYGLPKPMARQGTFGFTVGGPVYFPEKFNSKKDKLFFFANMEFLRPRSVNALASNTVPSALERQGDFSQTRDSSNKPVTIYYPGTSTPFPGNKIPEAFWDPLGVKILNWYPLPNKQGIDPTFNYQYQFVPTTKNDDLTFRIDTYISDKWRAYFRLTSNRNSSISAGSMGLWNNVSPTGVLAIAANLTTIISPTLTNEFSYGNSGNWLPRDVPNDAICLKANAGFSLPVLYPNADLRGLLPALTFGGVPNAPNIDPTRNPYVADNPTIDYTDNIAKVFSKHALKAGLFIENSFKRQTSNLPAAGSYYFDRDAGNPGDTNWAFSNALVGNFQAFTQSSALSKGYYRSFNYEWYVQDNWRLRPNLTLDFGIRFTLLPSMYDEQNQLAGINLALYDPAQQVVLYRKAINPATGKVASLNPITGEYGPSLFVGAIVPGVGNLNNGLVQAGKNGYPRGLMDNTGVHSAPRFGLAWTPGGPSGKTVLRAGAGVFYERLVGNVTYGMVNNPPTTRWPKSYYGSFSTLASLPQTNFPVSVSGMPRNARVPNTYNFSVGVQRELPTGVLLDVSYVGTLNRHQPSQVAYNEPDWGSAWLPQNQDPTVTPKYDGTTTLPIDMYRPYIGYSGPVFSWQAQGTMYNFGGSSNYNALQVAANRRMGRNFQYGLAYTWSKVLGTSYAIQSVMHPTDIRKANYGRLEFDRTQVFAFNYIYNVPSTARGVLDNAVGRVILNGWQVTGITSFSTGAPAMLSYTVKGIGATMLNRMITGVETTGPRVVLTGNPNQSSGDRSLYSWIGTAGIKPAVKGSHGMDSGQNSIGGPGLSNWDLSLFKKVQLGREAQRYIQLRLEMYNAFNHTQWSGYNRTAEFDLAGNITNLPTALGGGGGRFGFGAVNAFRTERRVQIGAKIYF